MTTGARGTTDRWSAHRGTGGIGSGKSTVLLNLAMHDIFSGQGVAVLDPHGDLADAIIDAIPRRRVNDICYLNVADREFPAGFNPLAGVPPKRHALAAAGIVSAFKHLWAESWGPATTEWLVRSSAMATTSSPASDRRVRSISASGVTVPRLKRSR